MPKNEKIAKITARMCAENYDAVYQFGYELSGLVPGLTFSPQVVYNWSKGMKPRMTSLVAIIYAAQTCNKPHIEQWAKDVIAEITRD